MLSMAGHHYKKLEDASTLEESSSSTSESNTSTSTPRPSHPFFNTRNFIRVWLGLATLLIFYCAYLMLFRRAAFLALVGGTWAASDSSSSHSASSSTKVPDYFQTAPELYPGPTATGRPPFLAESNPVEFPATVTFVPNAPLETAVPISGMTSQNQSIFNLMGNLSPYFPNPVGFGVHEYPLPKGANISQVQMLSRHGSRYPTTGSSVQTFGQKVANYTGKFNATGSLSFLNDWSYGLGAEILVPRGRQELFDSGILHYYDYGALYNPNSKIIARTTSQDRMLKSAEYFMAGFFGLEWTNNATIEVIIEQNTFNNSLAGYYQCPNNNLEVSAGGANASNLFITNYLANATARLQAETTGFNWTIKDTYAAQTLCPYETVAFGYSAFCSLFTYDEWIDFEYTIDLGFAGNYAFQSPTGRAVGVGYVQEVVARLENHTLGYSGSQINTTLDNNTVTFPLNQSLYFDFSHDTNIMSILTAMGLTQFSSYLPPTVAGAHTAHNLTVSHLEPFGARLDIEVIKTPHPFAANRTYTAGNQTTYVHLLLNQRTIPLGASFSSCDVTRLDGWCEFDTFVANLKEQIPKADYDYACFGDYQAVPYGNITDGAPDN